MLWEYMTVVVVVQYGGAGEADLWRARYINGVEVDNWKASPPVYQLMNQWGAEGWELVNITPVPTGNLFRMIFKRPSSSQTS